MSTSPAPVRNSHPLLGGFPLAVMALAASLLAFTLIMAGLTSARAPQARPAQGVIAATLLGPGTSVTVSVRPTGASAEPASATDGRHG